MREKPPQGPTGTFLKSKSGKKVEYFSRRAGGTISRVMAKSWCGGRGRNEEEEEKKMVMVMAMAKVRVRGRRMLGG